MQEPVGPTQGRQRVLGGLGYEADIGEAAAMNEVGREQVEDRRRGSLRGIDVDPDKSASGQLSRHLVERQSTMRPVTEIKKLRVNA